jgi:hypothetical protein
MATNKRLAARDELDARILSLLTIGVRGLSQLVPKLEGHRTTIAARLRAMEDENLVHRRRTIDCHGSPDQWYLGPARGADGKPVLKVRPALVDKPVLQEAPTFAPVAGRDFFVAALFGAPKQSAPRCVGCGSTERHISGCMFLGAA